MSKRKNIDTLFQEKLKNFETVPPQEVWDNIKMELEKKKKRRMIPFWWKFSGIAASLILGLWISNALLFDNSTSGVVIQEENKIIEDSKAKTSSSDNQFKSKKRMVIINSSSNKKNKTNQESKSKNFKEVKANAFVLSSKKSKNDSASIIPNLAQNSRKKTITNSFSYTKTYALNLENKDVNNNLLDKDKIAENIKLTNQTNTNNLVLSDTKENNLPLEENKKSKEVPNTQPNELEKLLKEKEKKPIKQKNQPRWQINSTVAPVYYSSLVDGSSLDSQFENNKKVYNTSKSFGVGINYALNKKIKLRTGINSLSVNYNTNDVPLNPTVGNGVSLTIQGSSIDIGFAGISQHNPSPKITVNQQMGYFEMPLEISYNVLNKKIGVDLIGGMSTLFLNQNSISTSLIQEKVSLGKANNLSNVHFSGNIGLGLKYEILKQLDFKVEPVFKYQINTYNSLNSNSKPYIFGIYSGIGFSF